MLEAERVRVASHRPSRYELATPVFRIFSLCLGDRSPEEIAQVRDQIPGEFCGIEMD